MESGIKTAAPAAFVTEQPEFGRGGWMEVCTALVSPSLSGCCRSRADRGHRTFELVLNPAVVAKQPDLTLEMSASE